MTYEDIAESVITATLPGSPMYYSGQTDFGVQDCGLACSGMPRIHFLALMYRLAGDMTCHTELYRKLWKIAHKDQKAAVRNRAGLLASLVLAEEHSPGLTETVGLVPDMLQISRSQYYRDVREVHHGLRARLDSWALSGMAHIARRCRS